MRIVKIILLQGLLLLALCVCGIFVMWILDAVLSLEYPSIFVGGAKAGFVAWLVLLAGQVYRKHKKAAERSLSGL